MRLLIMWFLSVLILVLGMLFAFRVPAAHAEVDPRCVDATQLDPAFTYDAVEVFRLCAPSLDVTGDILTPEELSTCSIVLDGVLYSEFSAAPGQYIEVASPTNGPKFRQVLAYCSGPAGNSDPTPTYTYRVRQQKPGKPLFSR